MLHKNSKDSLAFLEKLKAGMATTPLSEQDRMKLEEWIARETALAIGEQESNRRLNNPVYIALDEIREAEGDRAWEVQRERAWEYRNNETTTLEIKSTTWKWWAGFGAGTAVGWVAHLIFTRLT